MAQTSNVLTDVLEDRNPLRGIFVHYIAHLVVLRSILPNFRRIVRPPQVARKIMTSVNTPQASSRFLRLSKAECVLVLITMVWGGTFLLVQHAMTVSGPMFFVGLRFAAAAIIVALFSWRSLRNLTLFELKAGAFIGVAIMLGYGLQTVGLQSIPSSQSAFITALYVPFVPLLQWLVLGRRPGLMPSVGIMLAFTGLMLLSGPSGASLNFSPGEIATLISAIAIAAEIILISNFAGQVDVKRVTVVQLAVTSVLSFLMVVPTNEALPDFSWLLLCSALGLGAASAAIQVAMNWAQKSVSPTRATLIYAGEPVWAGIVGRIAGERLPAIALLGAGLIVAAVIVSELKTKGKTVAEVEESLESESGN
jgi:drug/metabolite transporter (DMT)-like permease